MGRINKTSYYSRTGLPAFKRRELSRSFDTLEAAQKFAEGKNVFDICKSHGRFKVIWFKDTLADQPKRVIYDGEEITPETAMKWFCWHELVSAMEKQSTTLQEAANYMNLPGVRDLSDWEYRFLRFFLDIAKQDLVIK